MRRRTTRPASVALANQLTRARRESLNCGVTRLADVTRLDDLGVHVFQTVRPWGRSLSVHQGKGLTAEAAMIGALVEAIECDHAETFLGDCRRVAFDQIDPLECAPTLLDFAADRSRPPDSSEPISWVAAEPPDWGRRLWVPFATVSLDLTREGPMGVERSSNGLGARFNYEGASLKALMEVVERDAEQAWRTSSLAQRSRAQVECGTISLKWFQELYARARSQGLELSIYRIPAVIALDVFYCEILEPLAGSAARSGASGAGCAFTAEEALMAAVLEAAQSRLTAISGVRDDIRATARSTCRDLGPALPPGGGRRLQAWDEVGAVPRHAAPATVGGIVKALAEAGYPQVGLVDLSRPGRDIRVVKAIVPGLGAFSRSRRRSAEPTLRRAA
jgi:ribosomal protein S12 methylthiotransferase accessory factor